MYILYHLSGVLSNFSSMISWNATFLAGVCLVPSIILTWRLYKQNQAFDRLKSENLENVETIESLLKIISIASHDMRSQLQFQNFLLKQIGTLPESEQIMDNEELLRIVKLNGQQLLQFCTNIVEWLLNIKKENLLVYERFDLSQTVKNIVFEMAEIVNTHNNKLICNLSDSLFINGDPIMIAAIIRNIIDNANKYTSKGIITVSVRLQTDLAILEIEDTGVGFDVQVILEKVRNFSKSDLKSLGMKIILDLLNKQNIKYEIKSNPKKGTVFTLYLPLSK